MFWELIVIGSLFAWLRPSGGLLLVLYATFPTMPVAFLITSLMTTGPDNPWNESVWLAAVGKVIVLGAEASPRINVPPLEPATKPFVITRPLAVIVIGPAIVRLYVSPG